MLYSLNKVMIFLVSLMFKVAPDMDKLYQLLNQLIMHFLLKFSDMLENKVGNCKVADQEKEGATSLSLHFWCSLLYLGKQISQDL